MCETNAIVGAQRCATTLVGRDRVVLADFHAFTKRRRAFLLESTRFLGVGRESLGDFEGLHANKSGGGRNWRN